MTREPVLALPSIHTLPRTQTASASATCACILAADIIGLSAVYWLTVMSRHLISPDYHLGFYLELTPCLLLFIGAFCTQGLYPALLMHPADEIRRVFNCITTISLLLAAGTFLWRNAESYSRSVFLITWACGAPVVLLSRHLVRTMFSHRRWWGIPVVVLVSSSTAHIIRSLQNSRFGLRVASVLVEGPPSFWTSDLGPVRGGFECAPELAEAKVAQYAIVAPSGTSNNEIRSIIQDYCRGFRHVLLIPGLTGLCSHGICAREVGGELGFELPQRLFDRSSGVLKRVLDIFSSLTLLILLMPVLLVVSATIKLTSRGSLLYEQKRCGRNGQVFKALKFRTMVQGADKTIAQHLVSHPELLSEWQRDHKLKCDPRVTRVGKWLRRYSVDELPQLWNVFMGQMSLVGPRPIVQDEIMKYGSNGYDLYTRVTPGITGLWQVSGRNNTTYAERVAYDEYYVRNWSIWLDVYILARTVTTVLLAEGAY